jgi:hypothetical protein
MSLLQSIIAIVNLMSLWHGINFRYLMDKFIELSATLIKKSYAYFRRKYGRIILKGLNRFKDLYLIKSINY